MFFIILRMLCLDGNWSNTRFSVLSPPWPWTCSEKFWYLTVYNTNVILNKIWKSHVYFRYGICGSNTCAQPPKSRMVRYTLHSTFRFHNSSKFVFFLLDSWFFLGLCLELALPMWKRRSLRIWDFMFTFLTQTTLSESILLIDHKII